MSNKFGFYSPHYNNNNNNDNNNNNNNNNNIYRANGNLRNI